MDGKLYLRTLDSNIVISNLKKNYNFLCFTMNSKKTKLFGVTLLPQQGHALKFIFVSVKDDLSEYVGKMENHRLLVALWYCVWKSSERHHIEN